VPTRTLILAAALAAAPWAQAQTVWRCGNSYGQQPCAGGAPVAASDARTPSQSAGSARVARDDWALAERLRRERLAQEKDAPRALVIGGAPVAPASAPKAGKKKAAKKKAVSAEPFTALGPAPVKAKKTKSKD
jgi:hypothetical protein